jgi:site-specific recombinase XerD
MTTLAVPKSQFRVTALPRGAVPDFALYYGDDPIKPVFDFLKNLSVRGFARTTIRAYAFDLLEFYRFLADHCLIIDHLSHQDFIDFILAHRRRNAAPRTINRRLVVVRSFLNDQFFGLGDSLLKKYSTAFYKGRRNKALLGPTRVKSTATTSLRVKVPTLIITPLSAVEIKKFLTSVRKYRDQVIVLLMLLCGLRSCEVLNLKISDIDFIDNQIRVRGKGNKERLLPMPKALAKSLSHYIDYERPECNHDKLITVIKGNNSGSPLKAESLRTLFRHRRLSKKLLRVHPHLLRHTFCTSMIRQGVSLPVVQKLMGHSDIEVTMLYVHTSIDDVALEYHKAITEMTKAL